MTLSIKIKNEKVKDLLQNLAALNPIEITDETKPDTTLPNKTLIEKTVTHLASEDALAKTWNTKEEDEAWKDL